MRRFFKWFALLMLVLLSLILIVGGLLLATFDPNDLKPHLVRMVKEKNQRSLSIPRFIRLSLLPDSVFRMQRQACTLIAASSCSIPYRQASMAVVCAVVSLSIWTGLSALA